MPATRSVFPLVMLVLCTTAWSAEQADFGKRKVEASTKITMTNSSGNFAPPNLSHRLKEAVKPALDIGKGRIEQPTELLLVEQVPPVPEPVAETRSAVAAFENPEVEPGKVRWHADFEAACAASRSSGKPVLLFQMMGNLDDRFC